MFIELDGVQTYYEKKGEGDPILLLHGWGVDSQTMRPILNHLAAQAGFAAYALDFPGFGLSDAPLTGWTVDDYVELVSSFLDNLGLAKVSIIAHSFGGRVAIKLASNSPERIDKLVLTGSAGIRPDRSTGYYLRVARAKVLKKLAGQLPANSQQWFEKQVLSSLGSADYQNASGTMRQTFINVVNEDLRDYLHRVSAPTLLVWGELDAETPLSDGLLMEQLIPNSSLEVLANAGHYSFLDDFGKFTNSVDSFLAGA